MGGVRTARAHAGSEPDAVDEATEVSLVEPPLRQVDLLAPARFELPSLTRALVDVGVLVRSPTSERRETTYYDSADLALAAHGITLQRLPEGVWTLDLGRHGEVPVRGELRVGGNGNTDVPGPIRDLLHTQLRSRHLLAVARLSSARTAVELLSPSRTDVVLVTHDDVTACDSMGRITRFGHVVLTSTASGHAGRTVLRALVDAFTAVGCAPVPQMNDLQLACGALSPPGPVPRPPMPRRARSATMADLVAPMLGASLHRLLAHDVGVRLGADPEDVHQLRVATRRLRADLRALRPVLDRSRADHLRHEVSWLGSLAGPVRDTDVLLEHLTAAVAALPEDVREDGARLMARLGHEQRDHHAALLVGMRTARYDALLDALVEAVAHPPVRAGTVERASRRASVVLTRALTRQWRDFAAGVARAGTSPTSAELHRVRIAAKHVRYTAEAAGPVLGKHAFRLAVLATRVQTTLGDLQDAVVAEAWLHDAASQPGLAVVAERLSRAEGEKADDLRANWRPLWKKIRPKAERELRVLTAR